MASNVIPLRRPRLDVSDEDLELILERLVRELVRLYRIEEAAERAMAKVAEHERVRYERIKLGAFAELRAALEG